MVCCNLAGKLRGKVGAEVRVLSGLYLVCEVHECLIVKDRYI